MFEGASKAGAPMPLHDAAEPVCGSANPAGASGLTTEALATEALATMLPALARLDRDVSDAERIDQLRLLEELKSGAAAAQARIAADFDASQRAKQAAAGDPAAKQGAGVAAQIALARRESPHKGNRLLGLAKALVHEMPNTLSCLSTGGINEWRATLLVRETACLDVEDRRRVDIALAGDPVALAKLGDAALVTEAKKLAYRLDAESVVRRARKAEGERRVTIRPAPDTMTYLTALLPVKEGVAVHAALSLAANSHAAEGDPRSRGQIMADTLVERVTGQDTADAVPVEVGLVMTDRTLVAGDTEPAQVPGYGVVPADLAREWVATATATGSSAWLRRLFTHPNGGDLVAMDSRRRLFPSGMRRFLRVRDQRCRSPWCDAPIRHSDHVLAHAEGGPTSARNGQGLCEACNHVKQTPGWRARPSPGRRHAVEIITPTGHYYDSTAPPLPGSPRPMTPLEQRFADIVFAA